MPTRVGIELSAIGCRLSRSTAAGCCFEIVGRNLAVGHRDVR
jgi:hypothetical protein